MYTHGGRTPSGIKALDWVKQAESLGAGEILLTSMDADGTKDGFDLSLTSAVSSTVQIPVIASGGAGKEDHFYDVFTKGKADAGLAATIFHYKEISIPHLKLRLSQKEWIYGERRYVEGFIPGAGQRAYPLGCLGLGAGDCTGCTEQAGADDGLYESGVSSLDAGKRETWFWSRSREELWHKGATSGNVQTVVAMTYDCDGDTLLRR